MTAGAQRILVCDDEPQILRALRVILRDADFDVVTAATAEEALDALAVRPPHAAILDLLLPDGDGVEVTRSIREWSEMPILVLSAVGEEAEKIRALEAGADDYVTKPFSPPELIARLKAALRRAGPKEAEEPVLTVDGLEVDFPARRVSLNGEEVHLTPTEFDLLRSLVRGHGRLMTHRVPAHRGLGRRVRARHPGAARAYRQPAQEDRLGTHHNRSGCRLPLRLLTKSVYAGPVPSRGLDAGRRTLVAMDLISIAIALAFFALAYLLVDLLERV